MAHYVKIRFYVVAKPHKTFPVGMLIQLADDRQSARTGLLLCDGAFVRVDKYPELYKAIGDIYCPPLLKEVQPRRPWWAFFKSTASHEMVPNPSYREGFFRIPNIGINHFVS